MKKAKRSLSLLCAALLLLTLAACGATSAANGGAGKSAALYAENGTNAAADSASDTCSKRSSAWIQVKAGGSVPGGAPVESSAKAGRITANAHSRRRGGNRAVSGNPSVTQRRNMLSSPYPRLVGAGGEHNTRVEDTMIRTFCPARCA